MAPLDIGWNFRDRTLLDAAYAGDGNDFQRLEFLGDAVADAVLVRWIHRWSTGTVAVLAGAREQITSDRTLARISHVTGLRNVLSPTLRRVPERPGDLIEALVGAAFLDGGWPAATAACEALFGQW
ncbi:MAG: Ribonuclease-III-like, partial [Actinomycetota bacterium]